MPMDDVIDPDDLVSLEETPYQWLSKADDGDLRSVRKENALGIVVFILYFYSVYQMVHIQATDPSRLLPWIWQFMSQVSVGFAISWAMLIRLKGGSDVWDVDFYRADGSRASGLVLLDGQPQTVEIEFLRDSIQPLRDEYERVKEQRIRAAAGSD